jgi:predicted nucleic acid-binding protein
MLRAVFDTNILISGMFWAGPPKAALMAVRGQQIELLASQPLIDELVTTLSRAKL